MIHSHSQMLISNPKQNISKLNTTVNKRRKYIRTKKGIKRMQMWFNIRGEKICMCHLAYLQEKKHGHLNRFLNNLVDSFN